MALVHFVKSWVTGIAPDWTLPYVILVLLAAYLVLLKIAAKRPDLEKEDPDAPLPNCCRPAPPRLPAFITCCRSS